MVLRTILKKISEKWLKKDSRFQYYHQKNKGVSSARNLAITKSVGKFILPLDSDDLISEDYIELAVNKFNENSSLKIVYCKARKFGEIEEDWNLPKFNIKTLLKGNIIFNTALYKKIDWEKIGGYDESLKEGYEDWDFWLGLLKEGGNVYSNSKKLFFI